MNRQAVICLDGQPVADLGAGGVNGRLRVTYRAAWLEREDATPLCALLPLGAEPRESPTLDAWFENLLPECGVLEAAAGRWRISPDDLLGLLIALGGNCVGAVEVVQGTAGRKQSRTATEKSKGRRRTATATGWQVDVGLRDVRTLAVETLVVAALPGMQRKVPVAETLGARGTRAVPGAGAYLLKPQSSAPYLPENEYLTLQIAAAAGIVVATSRLVTLPDGTAAHLVRRFDRTEDGRKLRMEDFCQLCGKRPAEKYDGSAESCADILRRHSSEPLVDLARLFRHLVVAWWTGNAHVHLKNLALLTDAGGVARLSPAYDLQCSALVDGGSALALPVGGRRDGFTRDDWVRFADACGLRRPATERVLRDVCTALPEALQHISESPLSEAARRTYAAVLRERAAVLGGCPAPR